MQAAPPVSVRGSGGGAWRGACLLLPVLSLTTLTAWVLGQWGVEGWRLGMLGVAGGCASALVMAWLLRLAGIAWWPSALTALVWDGQHWLAGEVSGHPGGPRLGGADAVLPGRTTGSMTGGTGQRMVDVAPEVMIDLGGWLLLRLRNNDGPGSRWMAISADESGAAWHGLRVALHARPPHPLRAATDRTRVGS